MVIQFIPIPLNDMDVDIGTQASVPQVKAIKKEGRVREKGRGGREKS